MGRAVLGQSCKKAATLGCGAKNELKGTPGYTKKGD